MHNPHHFRVRFIDLRMNEALEEDAASARVDRIAVLIEFHDVAGRDQRAGVAVSHDPGPGRDQRHPVQGHLGARLLIATGCLLSGLGWITAGYVTSLIGLYLTYGLFCGIGACYDCLLTIDGRPAQRACLVPVRDGMILGETGGD